MENTTQTEGKADEGCTCGRCHGGRRWHYSRAGVRHYQSTCADLRAVSAEMDAFQAARESEVRS